MRKSFNAKVPIFLYSCLFLLLLSCDRDADLLYEYALDTEEVIVIDDTFRVPADRISILDVLSNDLFTTGNVKIVETSAPVHGDIIINEDNTITYAPRAAVTDEVNEETASEETTPDVAVSEEGTSQEEVEEEAAPQETNTENAAQTEEVVEEANPQEVSSEDENSEEQTSQETSTEEEQAAGDEETTEEATVPEPATEEVMPDDSSAPEESAPEEENTDQPEEDTFTYTTETENEDGTTTTESGTVTVEVETEPEPEPEPKPEPVPEPEPLAETDYWREPVIAGLRLLDEKYYDLDTGEFYAKEVSLQRGQVANYIEHENCPQRIKDKWADRIEITPADVNGSQDGLKVIFESHPRGSLFFLRAGIYQDQKNAILYTDQTIVGEYGAILDGSGIQGNSEEATRAIRSLERGFICNLLVREYPTWNDPQYPNNPRGAALEAIQNGAILNCEVHSHNKAIAVNYGSKAMWNTFTAGRIGIHSVGTYDPNDSKRRGTIVKYNEWYDCNFNNYAYGYEAGGSKFVQLDGTILSHNYIHDNPTGPGIWEDTDNRDSEIYNNVIINTDRSIFSEASHTSDIHHNTIEYGLGFGSIQLSNSQGEKVHHNYVRWGKNGITINEVVIGHSKIYPDLAWRSINNEIYENYIWQRPDPLNWSIGKATLFDGRVDPNNTSNSWHDNHYYVDYTTEGAAPLSDDVPIVGVFMYSLLADDSDNITLAWEEWKALSGDTNSTLQYAQFF